MIVIYDDEFVEERTLPTETLLRAHGVILVNKKSNSFRVLKHRFEDIDSGEKHPFNDIRTMIGSMMNWLVEA